MYGGRVYGKRADMPRRTLPAREDVTPHGCRKRRIRRGGPRRCDKTFGTGCQIVGIDGDKLTVRFTKTGKTKTLLKGYAPIVKLEQNK